MRYAQRGGYTPAEQEKRELLRLEAAERFERGEDAAVIAAEAKDAATTRFLRPSGGGSARSSLDQIRTSGRRQVHNRWGRIFDRR